MRFRTLLIWLVLYSATSHASAGDNNGVLHASFGGQVTISADGRATIGPLTGVTGALAQAVRTQFAALRFVPMRLDGVPVESTVPLRGDAALTPVGDNYDVRLARVSFAPRLKDAEPPLYPASQVRAGKEGAVELMARIGADGRIEGARTISSSDPAFEKAVRDAMRTWRFDPLPRGAAEIGIAVPAWFHLDRKQPGKPVFQCPLDANAAHVESQDGCMDLFEVVGSRVLRSSIGGL